MQEFPKGIIWGILALILIFVVSLGVFLYKGSRQAATSVAGNLNQFKEGISDLNNLEPDLAAQKFGAAGNDIGTTTSGIFGKLKQIFGGAGDLFSSFRELTRESVVLAEEVSFLENNFLELTINKKGEEIISRLETVRKTLGEIAAQSDKLSSLSSQLNFFSPAAVDFYIPLKLEIARYEPFLDSLVHWLKSDSQRPASEGGEARLAGRHVLLMFQNPSEIRPAGGFLGSYGDVTLEAANLENVIVHDVNDADNQLDLKIIPPRPLWTEVTRWRAADANWFLDFSASAGQVIKFLETSKIYSGQPATFDGAIAVSPKVLGDILGIVGPVELPNSRIILDKDNFLLELQKRVQLGQAKHATYPKSVLKDAVSVLLTRLTVLDDAEKQSLFRLAQDWINKKDLIFYFKDPELEKFFGYYAASGRVYELMPDFEGDYLAIVDANVGGGKSDLFIKQNVTLESQIGADGIVTDHLVISRDHEGNNSKYSWYRLPNLDYLQLFLAPNADLVNFKGGFDKSIAAPLNYSKGGYTADDALTAIESSTEKIFNYPAVSAHEESGKKVFTTWSKIKAGEKTQIIFDYKHRLYFRPSDGQTYKFIFEKQAGTQRDYKFTISAPVGFKFKESGSPVYEYATSDPPGRLILDLTLEKI